ncbi:GDNF family receptor alpha-like [Paramisgurnus dabryanus]|uniref:GDNF family receptor alpha-like n=1 Tax=Paramisgurnus dabryanus TaxID=90735 RepID=UPI0031F3E641
MDACVSHHFCKNEQGFFRQICDFKDGSCQLTDPKICNGTLQMILTRSAALGDCLCYTSDPCSTLQQLYSQCQQHLEKKELEAKWQASAQTGHGKSCLEETMACLEDEICNRNMVPFVQACSPHKCRPRRCRQAMGQFYSALPHNIAEKLVFCDCDREDQECQQMKTSLHSSSCETDHVQTPWTCLEMLDCCSEDQRCRKTFTRYLSECFGAEELPYDGRSTSDWLQQLDPDFFLGEEHQCRVAFVATMGSVLHNPCVCDGVPHHDLHRCNELQQIFQNKSLFKLSRTKDKLSDETSVRYELTNDSSVQHQPTNDSSAGWQLTNESSAVQLSDQLLYFLTYVSVLTVVVLLTVSLVLHRLRRLHQAAAKQQRFEAHQSKSLMLVSENI